MQAFCSMALAISPDFPATLARSKFQTPIRLFSKSERSREQKDISFGSSTRPLTRLLCSPSITTSSPSSAPILCLSIHTRTHPSLWALVSATTSLSRLHLSPMPANRSRMMATFGFERMSPCAPTQRATPKITSEVVYCVTTRKVPAYRSRNLGIICQKGAPMRHMTAFGRSINGKWAIPPMQAKKTTYFSMIHQLHILWLLFLWNQPHLALPSFLFASTLVIPRFCTSTILAPGHRHG